MSRPITDMSRPIKVRLDSLCTQFPRAGGGISNLACPVVKTPHYAFARRTLTQLALSPTLTFQSITGTGYGTYCRYEYYTLELSKRGAICRGYDAEGLLEGQSAWHTPRKYFELICQLLDSMAKGKGVETLQIEVMPFQVDSQQYYYIVDGAHRAAFLQATLGSDVPVEVTLLKVHKYGLAAPTNLVQDASLVDHLNPFLNGPNHHNRKA